jgi:hypothetical protein
MNFRVTFRIIIEPVVICYGFQAREIGIKLNPENSKYLYISSVKRLLNDEREQSYLPKCIEITQIIADFMSFLCSAIQTNGKKLYGKTFQLKYVQW